MGKKGSKGEKGERVDDVSGTLLQLQLLAETERRQRFWLAYLLLLLTYLAINLALFGLNFREQEFIEEHYYLAFHLLEFWAVFCFTVVEAFVMVSLGKLAVVGAKPLELLQLLLLTFNVVFTLITAIVFSMCPEAYEVPAHYMEYSAQLLITLVNFLFLLRSRDRLCFPVKLGVGVLALLLALLELLLYSSAIPTDGSGDGPGAERTAHFIEFLTEALNAFFILTFATTAYRQTARHLLKVHQQLHKRDQV